VQVMMASGNVGRAVAAIRGGGLALDYVSSDPGVIDITPRGVGKWSALLALCRMEGIPPENVAAAGNYLNDRDMIEHAGIGIAVGNALTEIKALADIVLQHDCEHDAIAELVDKLLAM
jgi:hydroxymethylpyrimidine pyrophosphatase-like HAD family hydrolase